MKAKNKRNTDKNPPPTHRDTFKKNKKYVKIL